MTFYIIMVAISYFSLCVCVKKNEKKWENILNISLNIHTINQVIGALK